MMQNDIIRSDPTSKCFLGNDGTRDRRVVDSNFGCCELATRRYSSMKKLKSAAVAHLNSVYT